MILREMQRWQGLLQRENILKELTSERENLLASLILKIEEIKDDFENRTGQKLESNYDKPPSVKGLSETVSIIVWCRSLKTKVERI